MIEILVEANEVITDVACMCDGLICDSCCGDF